MLSFLFLRYLSDNYEAAAQKELGRDYPQVESNGRRVPLAIWYANNPDDVADFEKQMRRKVHYVIKPDHLWASIANLARTQSGELLNTLQAAFKYIETESFQSTFQGLFSEINLASDKLGKKYEERNAKLCTIIQKIAEGLTQFSTDADTLGDAYEYLIGQFAAGSGKKAGEFYTPQQISSILSGIVTLDSQDPKTGKKAKLDSVMDFACGSGSLLLNVRKRMGPHGIGKIYGQESNITTYNLARMNMLLHGVSSSFPCGTSHCVLTLFCTYFGSGTGTMPSQATDSCRPKEPPRGARNSAFRTLTALGLNRLSATRTDVVAMWRRERGQ
jgi:type I restriction enzyme M protein